MARKNREKPKTVPKPKEPEKLEHPTSPDVPKPDLAVNVVSAKPEPPAELEPVESVRVEGPKPTKPAKGLSPDEEIARLRKRIAEDEARIWELEHPVQEYPKMVKGQTFNSKEEQDAAGPEFKD